MSVDGRNQNALKILLYILMQLASSKQICIVLVDLHVFDSASINLASLVFTTLPNILGVMTTRPLPKDVSIEFSVLFNLPCVRQLHLKPLTPEGSLELARHVLGVRSLPDSVADVVLSRGQGKPLHIEELAKMMLQEKMVKVVRGQLILSAPPEQMTRKLLTAIPVNIREWVSSRIDRMQAGPHLTLQVLSVLGREVPIDLLVAAHPGTKSSLKDIEHDIKNLEEANFVSTLKPDNQAESEHFTIVFQVHLPSPDIRFDYTYIIMYC